MYQSVFLDAYIHKASEIGDVGHDAGQNHTFFKVINGLHILVELEYLDGLARVSSGLFQFGHDVHQGRESYLVAYIFLDVNLVSDFLVLDQVFHRTFHVFGDEFHHGITFGVYGRVIQWVFRSRDAKEAGTLFKCFGTHTGNFHQFLAGGEGSVFRTIIHDVLGEGRTQAGDVSQQMTTGRVEVYSHGVHTTFYGGVQ